MLETALVIFRKVGWRDRHNVVSYAGAAIVLLREPALIGPGLHLNSHLGPHQSRVQLLDSVEIFVKAVELSGTHSEDSLPAFS